MRSLFLLFIGFGFLFTASCTLKNAPPQPIFTSANAKGSVSLYDEGTTQLNDSGMTVTASTADTSISVVTDTTGQFFFKDLTYDTYNLTFEKEGYGTFKIFDLLHDNGSSFLTTVPSLGQKSSTEVIDLTQSQFEQSILVNATLDPPATDTEPKYIRFFLGLTDSISDTQYMEFSQIIVANTNPVVLTFSQEFLNGTGFDSGTTVYIRVYGDSYYSNNYEAPTSGQIFPNLNPNSVTAISFIVP